MAYSAEIKKQAESLYRLGASVEDIRQELNLPNRRVIYNWAEKWHTAIDTETLKFKTTRRLNWLIEKPHAEKSKADLAEELHKAELLIKLEKADGYRRGDGFITGGGPGRKPGQKSGSGKKREPKPKKNDVTQLSAQMLQEVEDRVFYPHQKLWIKAGENPKTARRRFILKSRQIGATYTFAWEAFKTAILTGNDQIFISSTKAQAEQFKAYIAVIAKEHFDIELTGNPTKLITEHGTVEIHYLSPNSYANSRSGDVYFDEVFYTRSFAKMEKVAKPMATRHGLKKTYFGAPTALSHEAMDLWTGKRYSKHRPGVSINVADFEPLYGGRLDDDGFWRCVCTVDSAIEMGWDQVKIEELMVDTPDPAEFDNVYRCQPIDDSFSVFKLSDVLACGVDPLSWYPDFDPDYPMRPAGNIPMSVGYDPAGIGDNAAISVCTRPYGWHEKFRLFEKQRYRGMVASQQAQKMVDIHRRYNVEYLDIDKTGPGIYIPGEVQQALQEAELDVPQMKAIMYSVELKSRMVQKAINVISQRRFEYDEDDKDLPMAFMAIRQSTTPKSGQVSYYSARDANTGHADEAWATMHCFMAEPMNVAVGDEGGGSVAFSD